MNKENESTGFVCPKWAINLWDPTTAMVCAMANGLYAVVCNATQVTVFVGTQADCEDQIHQN
jgi:hypothetical protein